MKIIYYSSPFYADCDFPLIGELQRKGHDVRYYISIASFSKRSTLIDLKELYPHTGIYPATEIYKEFNEFRNILDLSHVYIVNQKYKQKFHPVNLLLMIKLVIHFMMQKPDVIHLTEPPCLTQKLLYLIKKKLVLTVHDPFRHSGFTNKMAERNRRLAFKNISKLVLLNERLSSSFASYYDVPKNHVFINKLGMYNCIQHIDPLPFQIDRPFILFFGQIVEYKGVEYLLEAMKIVHSHHPELMLVIAGGGKYYFDIEPYKKLDYVKIINHYIGTRDLAGMLRACEFGVCPYKDATQSGVIQTAFTLEVPMVVTNVGALADAVQHNKTGIVVKPCDVNDLANGIMDLYSNKEKLNAMRKNIKEEWKKDMGWDSIANDYLKCYKNMKILEVVFNLRPGGAERFAVDLTNELSKANDVTIMAIKDDSVEPERDLFYASELAERVTYKNVGISNGYSLHKVIKIYKAIKNEKADIVHLHGDNMPHYCILAILLLNRKSKFYQTIHNDIHNGYDTLFYRFLVKTFGYKKKMGFVALSETNYRDMLEIYPKIKGVCIPNGRAPIVPTDRFEETRKEIASYKSVADSRIYLHVARCNPQKNQTLLVEAFGKFVQKGYHADLIIIGPGFENKLGESIRAKAGKNIHFIGTRKNVGNYILHADAFCLSSDFEGMPITLLEASLVGVPIVSTPVCGAVDIIDNKVNGILSKGHTVEEYLDALEYSYKHLSELRQNSLKMKDKSSYTIENCARKYMEFFNR